MKKFYYRLSIIKLLKFVWGFLFISLSLVPVSSAQQTDSAKYRIRVFGMNIGEFTVNQKTVGRDIHVEAITNVEVKIIFTYRVKYIQESYYKDGILWNSHVQTIKNGNVYSDILLKREGEAYLITKDGSTDTIHGKITYSGSLLYFNEPEQVQYLYKERTGEKSHIKCIADHTYALMDEKNNKTNKYEYKDGVLDRAALIHPIATIYLERLM